MKWAKTITGKVAIIMVSVLIVVQVATVYFFLNDEDLVKTADIISGWLMHMIAWTNLTGILLVAFAIWATSRVTKPFRNFSKAADRIGRGEMEEPLKEEGTAELVQASAAFNQMQRRIKRLIEERTRMLAAVAHDMRTAVTRLNLRSMEIENDTLRAKIQHDITEMSQIMETALTFARDDSAKEPHQKVDVAALLKALADDAEDIGDTVTYSGPDALITSIKPISFHRAVQNLVSNALKYAGQAVITLCSEGDALKITIYDSGMGIPDDQLETMKEAYARLDTSRSKDTGGLGLGLTIANDIVLSHGGTLTLKNRTEGGLEASITIPL